MAPGQQTYVAFNGDVTRDLASQFMALAEKQGQTVPLMIGHRLMGNSLTLTGDISKGRAHYNQAFALYDPATHRALATRFGQDVGVSTLSIERWPGGCSVIPRPHSRTLITRSSMHVTVATLGL